jgi:hypothetical protein
MEIILNSDKEDEKEMIVWITDYRHLDIVEKPIRHIKPTKGILKIRDISLPKKNFYYNKIHHIQLKYSFIPLKKNNEIKSKEIKLYDNCNYPEFVKIFTTEDEAKIHYKKMAKEILNQYNEYFINVKTHLNLLKSKYENL